MLIDTKKSPYAKAHSIPWSSITLKDGFWKERFDDCASVTITHILDGFDDPNVFHVVENFKIAAKEAEGRFRGTPYGDGDFYKLLEGAIYALSKNYDAELERRIDDYIALIGRAQQPDGYLSTKQIIGEREGAGVTRHGNINDFEVYNFGHMFTAACAHKRLTGKDTFLNIAMKCAAYLKNMYEESAKKDEVKTAVCPSHYMGLVELYRTTGNREYLDLAKLAIDLRDTVKDGTDDNQDRIPLREHEKIVGHAVRSTYLYAGVADVYMENGDETYKTVIDRVWKNLTDKKLYITGGCGALYNGVSPYGLFPKDQKIHQAFGYEYQLPNVTAYNETCATLGNIFWTQRMFAIDPDPVYFDVIERSMINLALAAVSLDGNKYFYENMLRRTKTLDYRLRWPLTRSSYLSCFCCPTNLSRCIMEAMEYAYMAGNDCVYTGMYGSCDADFSLDCGASFTLSQQTDYPWEGSVRFTLKNVSSFAPFTLKLRIPGWAESGSITVCGKTTALTSDNSGTYFDVNVTSAENFEAVLNLDMPARYTVANPMVEETAGQAAVERGPVVYCIESPDAGTETIDDLNFLSNAEFKPVSYEILGKKMTALETEAGVLKKPGESSALYRTLKVNGLETVPVRMIPYYAWDNRGFGEMRIWFPMIYRF